MVRRCMIKSVVSWLHILVVSLLCVYVALFGSRQSLLHSLVNENFDCTKKHGTNVKKIKNHFLYYVYGCEIWSLAISEENWLRVFENWVLRKTVLGRDERKWQENGENCRLRSFVICILHQTSLGSSSQARCLGRGTWYIRERCTCRILLVNSEGKRPLGRSRPNDDSEGNRMGRFGPILFGFPQSVSFLLYHPSFVCR